MSLDCCIFVAKICNKEDMDTKQARPQLSFTDAVKSTWQNITNFSGRARRSELWWSFWVYAAVSTIGSSLLSSNAFRTAILCPTSMASRLSIADYNSDNMPIVCES